MGPPSITGSIWKFKAKSIEEAGGEEVRNTFTFFVGKAGVFMVCFWAGEVDFFVGGVKITASNDGFFFFEGF